MGTDAGYVASRMRVVKPKPSTKAGSFTQPVYARGRTSNQTSPKLKWHQGCVADALKGKNPGTQKGVRDSLKAAAAACKTKNPF